MTWFQYLTLVNLGLAATFGLPSGGVCLALAAIFLVISMVEKSG